MKDPIIVSELRESLLEYFSFNDVGEILAETLWAAHKVTIRGKLIQIAARRKRERLSEIENLVKYFITLSKPHKKIPPMSLFLS